MDLTTIVASKPAKWQTISLLSDWEQFQPAWDEFVERHPKGSVFHTSAMIQVFAAAKGHTVLPLAAVSDSGDILSLMVAVRVQTLPNMFGSVSSRSVWYAEPLCLDTPESIDSLSGLVAEHDREYQRRALFSEIRPLWACGPERVALERCGYQHLDYLNYIIDTTQPVEALWRRVHDSAQSHTRKCERRGYELRAINTPDCVDVLYGFLRSTYGRAGVPL